MEEELPKATINGRRFSTVYCTEHRKWNVKTVFEFICCKVDLCVPCDVHYRTRNGSLHLKVWKSQGRSFNESGQETQELIFGQEDGRKTLWLLKQVQKAFLMSDRVHRCSCLDYGPLRPAQPLHRGFYKCLLKEHSDIKSNRVSMYLKRCLTSAEERFMQRSQRLTSKWTWNQTKNTLKCPINPINLCPSAPDTGGRAGSGVTGCCQALPPRSSSALPWLQCLLCSTSAQAPFPFCMDRAAADCPAPGAGSSAKEGRGQSGWHLLIIKNTVGFCGNTIIQDKLLLQAFLEAIPQKP